MRILSIVALGLTLLAQAASALDICPTGSLADYYLEVNIPDTFIADNCNMSSNVQLNVYAPANTSATYFTVQNSYFQTSGYLYTYFEGVAAAVITIKNNYFSAGAYIMLGGALPANSSITIQGNQMLTYSYAIHNSGYLFLSSFSVLNITDNNVSASNPNNEENQIRAFDFGDLELGDSSAVNILRNKLSASDQTYGTLMNIPSLYLGANSSLRVEENTFTTDTIYGVNGLVNYVSGDRSAIFSFSNNIMSISNVQFDSSYPLYFGSARDVTLLIDNNQISYNTTIALYAEELSSLAGFSISGNTIQSTNGSITSDIIQIYEFEFSPNSSYSVTNNKVSAPSVTTTDAHLLYVDTYKPAFVYYIADNSTLIASCGNSLPWSANPTLEQLFSAEILPAVTVTQCSETTRAPSSSRPRGPDSVFVAVACCLLTTVFVFTF